MVWRGDMLARPKEIGLTPAEPFHGGVVEHPFPAPQDTDMHQAFELGVLLSGGEDRQFEETVVPVGPGDVWLCGAWEPHGWRATAPGTRELVLQFLPEFLGEEMVDSVSWLSLFSAPPARRPRVQDEGTRAEVKAIAEEVRREMVQRRRGWLTAVRLGILRLLLAISRQWAPPDQPGRQASTQTSQLARVMPAVRLVHSQPARRLTLGEAAATCGLSISQFGYVFRQAMGLSFGKFCMRARLAYVAQMLLTSKHSVETIAQAGGFADASHLHHAFAKVYGCTPASYRANGARLRGPLGYLVLESSNPNDPGLHRRQGGPPLPEVVAEDGEALGSEGLARSLRADPEL